MNTLLATIKSTSTKGSTGSFEAVLSMPTVDRDGEIVDPGAFNPLPDHITIDVDHAMSVEKTIGSGVPFYDGDTLKFKGSYASTPLAQMVRTLVDEGHIRTMSVAFHPGTALYQIDDKDGLPHLRRGELLNAGIVGIPANREALITASKSFVAELAEVTDPDLMLKTCPSCAKTLEASNETTNTAEKAAVAADVKSPAAPATSSVGVTLARVELVLADAALAI